jgi:GTPase
VMASANVVDLSLKGYPGEFIAGEGQRGGRWRKHGRKGDDLTITVPAGTMVFEGTDRGEKRLLADLREQGQSLLVARGGRGGLGNVHFATAVNQAPEVAGKGRPGQERCIILELRLITDICIIGPPNSGKSTLLAAISRARPDIADYPFTTRQPALGVLPGDSKDYVVAELPGLVDGAHLGKGLGNGFLRHVERTRLLIYLLDGSSPVVVDDLRMMDREIAAWAGLPGKPRVLVVNKIDLPEVQAELTGMKQSLARISSGMGAPVFYISAASGQGVLELIGRAVAMVDEAGQEGEETGQPQVAVFRPRPQR